MRLLLLICKKQIGSQSLSYLFLSFPVSVTFFVQNFYVLNFSVLEFEMLAIWVTHDEYGKSRANPRE